MRKIVPDDKILRYIDRKLSSCNVRPPSKVMVASVNGDVTLTGTLQYEHQRQSVTQALRGIEGIRRIIDRLIVKPAARRT